MRDEYRKSSVGSRLNQRSKRRKTNLILNSLIAIVIVLIIIVATAIFSDGKKDNTDGNENSVGNVEQEENSNDEAVTNESNINLPEEVVVNESDDESEATSATNDQVIVEEDSSDSNVKSTIINPAWKPVGTEQTGVHDTTFEKGSIDWLEMEKALAYGANIDETNMTTWFIGNGGPNQAIGTVSAKDDEQAYRVYIEWVDGQGWKPTKVEELLENDKAQRDADE